MIVKIHSQGVGGGAGPIDYLLGKDRKREQALVLRGDVDQTHELIDSLSFARNYTSGVMSFSEEDLPEKDKETLMNALEHCLLAGLESNQYDCLWVEHRDKGRLELNFLIPNVELLTGKRLQPYYDKIDRKRKDAFQTIMNDRFNLSDPNDPAIRRSMSYGSKLPENKKDKKIQINKSLMDLVKSGVILNRDDVIETLKNSGFEIKRETDISISVREPGEASNMRLTGALYERDFRGGRDAGQAIKADIAAYQTERPERVQRAKQFYTKSHKGKLENNRIRYKPAQKFISKRVEIADNSIRKQIAELAKQNNVDLLSRNDNGVQSVSSVSSVGVQISNNQINNKLKKYERHTETTGISNQVIRTKARTTASTSTTTVGRISDAIKRLSETVGDYATAVIRLAELRREKRIERKPSIGFGR
jgi:hypothetical protein